MPIYDFWCTDHGAFSGWASYESSRSGAACPHCGQASGVMVALPQISRLSTPLRRAESRAETASAEPKVLKRRHLPNCGCRLCGRKAPPTSRRWMLGQC